jgi:hypothetical protein
MDDHARIALLTHLTRRTRQPGCSHVLDTYNSTGLDDFECCFKQQFLGEWNADLNARALGF